MATFAIHSRGRAAREVATEAFRFSVSSNATCPRTARSFLHACPNTAPYQRALPPPPPAHLGLATNQARQAVHSLRARPTALRGPFRTCAGSRVARRARCLRRAGEGTRAP